MTSQFENIRETRCPRRERLLPGLLAFAVLLFLLPGASKALAQAAGPDQANENPANVARISFTQGSVQLGVAGQTNFEQALVNMPVLAGSEIKAGKDGEVEVAFNDGSVARLAPNSTLDVTRIGSGGVAIEQQSGLGYYELNTGDGHPPFHVTFQGGSITPAANTIFRLDLDAAPQIAVMSGAVQMTGENQPTAEIGEGQSLDFTSGGSSPYTIANSIAPNSWDEWNQDRDQAISQQASQQTTVRDSQADTNNSSWNDLDYYGNWYPVAGSGNVWVPYGMDAGWDPFGYGYWGLYPGFGYTWISGYPWGWLPYHCGSWNYFSFGWGWMPGGCGTFWAPVTPIYGYSGYMAPVRPARPIVPLRAGGPVPYRALIRVNRGARAYGPWGPGWRHSSGRPGPVAEHGSGAILRVGNRTIHPITRQSFRGAAFAGNRGTSPGVRSVLGTAPPAAYPRRINRSQASRPGAPIQNVRRPAQNVGRPGPPARPVTRGPRTGVRPDHPVSRPQPPRMEPRPRVNRAPRPMPRQERQPRPMRAPEARPPAMRAPEMRAPVMRAPAPSAGHQGRR